MGGGAEERGGRASREGDGHRSNRQADKSVCEGEKKKASLIQEESSKWTRVKITNTTHALSYSFFNPKKKIKKTFSFSLRTFILQKTH